MEWKGLTAGEVYDVAKAAHVGRWGDNPRWCWYRDGSGFTQAEILDRATRGYLPATVFDIVFGSLATGVVSFQTEGYAIGALSHHFDTSRGFQREWVV